VLRRTNKCKPYSELNSEVHTSLVCYSSCRTHPADFVSRHNQGFYLSLHRYCTEMPFLI
jgi:hypothetical protein